MGLSDDTWVWVVFYGFFIATLLVAIIAIVESKKNRGSSIRILLVAPILFIVFFVNSFYRSMETEFEHLFDELLSFKVWAWFCILLFAYIISWWVTIMIRVKRRFSGDR